MGRGLLSTSARDEDRGFRSGEDTLQRKGDRRERERKLSMKGRQK